MKQLTEFFQEISRNLRLPSFLHHQMRAGFTFVA